MLTATKLEARKRIWEYFCGVAKKENEEKGLDKIEVKLTDLLDKTYKERLLIVIPESIGDCIYALAVLESTKKSYPKHDIYIATEEKYFPVFHGNPYIYRLIPYQPVFDSEIFMIGMSNEPKYFDVYINLVVCNQKMLNYLSNRNIALPLCAK